MNETIGIKGGKNDRKRKRRIKKKKEKKLQNSREIVLVGHKSLFLPKKVRKVITVSAKPMKSVGIGLEEKKTIKEETNKVIKAYGIEIEKKENFNTNENKELKIITYYQEELKNISLKLQDLSVIDKKDKNDTKDNKSSNLISKVEATIQKLENLKPKVGIDNSLKEEEKPIKNIINKHLEELKEEVIKESQKDSLQTELLSSKLEELTSKENKKEEIDLVIEEKEQDLELNDDLDDVNINEEKLAGLKKKYNSVEKLNKKLISFTQEQEAFLKDIRLKIDNSITIKEKIETELSAMDNQTKKLRNMLILALFFPGSKLAKTMALSTTVILEVMRQIIKPKTVEKKYQVITVEDYSRDIKKSITNINEASNLLSKTSDQIDKMLFELEEEFGKYRKDIKEYNSLKSNLSKIKDSINEKSFELEKLGREQYNELYRNNEKVYKRGKYQL